MQQPTRSWKCKGPRTLQLKLQKIRECPYTLQLFFTTATVFFNGFIYEQRFSQHFFWNNCCENLCSVRGPWIAGWSLYECGLDNTSNNLLGCNNNLIIYWGCNVYCIMKRFNKLATQICFLLRIFWKLWDALQSFLYGKIITAP